MTRIVNKKVIKKVSKWVENWSNRNATSGYSEALKSIDFGQVKKIFYKKTSIENGWQQVTTNKKEVVQWMTMTSTISENKRQRVKTTAQKMKLSIKDFFGKVNVTKSEVSCGFGHIYWRNP